MQRSACKSDKYLIRCKLSSKCLISVSRYPFVTDCWAVFSCFRFFLDMREAMQQHTSACAVPTVVSC